MNKPVLAIDIDDVLVSHYPELAAFLNNKYGTKLKPEDFSQFRGIETIQQDTGATEVEIIEVVNSWLVSPAFYARPDIEAPAAIAKLKARYRPVIITARPTIMEQMTTDWLHQHFPETFEDIRFVGANVWGHGSKANKANVMRDLHVTVLVDDHPKHCTISAEMGIRTILFGHYSWNQLEAPVPGIERAANWQEVCSLLL